MELDYPALGQRLRHIRKSQNMTQETLAEKVGIEPSNISHIERAASKVGLNTLVKIANVLGVSVNDLLCDSILCERARDCSPKELRLITDLVCAMKDSMRKREYDK